MGPAAQGVTAYLDTMAAVYILQGMRDAFPTKAAELIDSADLLVSPFVILELQYLFECKKVTLDGREAYLRLHERFGIVVCRYPLAAIVLSVAVGESWTRDPFDRMIVAHAKANSESLLISGDRTIRKHYRRAVW